MSERKSSIAILLIITAGLGLTLGILRATASEFTPSQLWDALARPRNGWSARYAFELCLELGVFFGCPLLAGCTSACLGISLLAPRPRRRRLVREPGFVACLLATVMGAMMLAVTVAYVGLSGASYNRKVDSFLGPSILCGCLAGASIAGSWAAMIFTGAWRPTASWTDRLGRLAGAAWIVHAVLCGAYIFLAIH